MPAANSSAMAPSPPSSRQGWGGDTRSSLMPTPGPFADDEIPSSDWVSAARSIAEGVCAADAARTGADGASGSTSPLVALGSGR